jgi:hypothetical protein
MIQGIRHVAISTGRLIRSSHTQIVFCCGPFQDFVESLLALGAERSKS